MLWISQIHCHRGMATVLFLATIPACADRKDPSRETAPAVAIVDGTPGPQPKPGATDSIPPPRLVLPAAEPTDSREAMDVFCIACADGTWKFQYPNGVRVKNDLHLPVGRPVKFTLTAEEGAGWFGLEPRWFEVPAFLLAIDVWPSRFSSGAVLTKRTGEFGIWDHSGKRVGTVIVMEAAAYKQLIAPEPELSGKDLPEGSAAFEGRKLFMKLQCVKCHVGKPNRAPTLEGLFGTKIQLKGGKTVTADEAYIRESILKPRATVVEGWDAIMPSYEGQVTEEELTALVAFIRSLKPKPAKADGDTSPAPVGPPRQPGEIAPPPREKPGG